VLKPFEYLEFIPHAPILCAGPAAFVMGLSSVLPSLICLLRVGTLKWEFEALATGASCNIILLRMPQPKIRCSFLRCFTLEAQVFQMCYTVKALAAVQWSMQSSISVDCHSGDHGRLPCSHCCIQALACLLLICAATASSKDVSRLSLFVIRAGAFGSDWRSQEGSVVREVDGWFQAHLSFH